MSNLTFAGMENIGRRILASPHCLLALDYDGTLTPIVDDPTWAFLAPAMRQLLAGLGQRTDVKVAIVSGRAHADLQKLVGVPELIYASNHGMEISGPGLRFLEPTAQAAAHALRKIAVELADKLRSIRGAIVEDKGLTLSIHYRQVAPADAEEVWRTVLRAVEPVSDRFHVTRGNKVYEVRPRVRWDKGAAVRWIKGQLGPVEPLVLYIGDDVTDEDAFLALNDGAITIKVGGSTATTAAQHVLPSTAEVHDFLAWMDGLLKGRQTSA